MSALTLLVYMISFALGCMTLALAIVYNMYSSHQWTKFFIICHASLLGCMMLLALQFITDLFLVGTASVVVGYLIGFVFIANVTFLTVFLPYFTTWVIAHPWRNPYKTFFYILAGVYLSLGIFHAITGNKAFDDLMILLFVFVVGFCLIIVLKNLSSIENKTARATCITIIIVSAAMLPSIVLSLVFPSIKPLMYGVYFLAFSISVMTFLFMEFVRLAREGALGKKDLALEDLVPYHITEREFVVIQLVSNGLTNKEIAADLGISANTVNNHVANIFSKTKVRSRIDLLNLLKQTW
ncbi:MAG TPA: helix-turn-helix transcriptional regulator [Sphaerochaeta sp.]|nr:helix-turn-helix transcriptional regulator [Sphaerochaeta sp.]